MSRETVIALRRFTEKLAAPGAMAANYPSGPMPSARAALGEPVTSPESPPTRFDLEPGPPKPGLSAEKTTTGVPAPVQSPAEYASVPYVEDHPLSYFTHHGAPEGEGLVNEQSWLQSLLGNVDMRMLGGMGLGGLGAYGLARLLQSEEERKKNRFPWLSTLAGTAAGGYLLPALMNNSYVQSAGNAVGNAASSAMDSARGLMGGNA
jgi:hypothetical protein